MPPITALLHTKNDALRLGRALETLFPCDEVLIVDHHSEDATRRVARQYGARIVAASDNVASYSNLVRHSWILSLLPTESISEGLQASLYEWASLGTDTTASAFSVFVREETSDGWLEHPTPEIRLVPTVWNRWRGHLPVCDSSDSAAIVLEGELLRFSLP
jgi:hypothetical protein